MMKLWTEVNLVCSEVPSQWWLRFEAEMHQRTVEEQCDRSDILMYEDLLYDVDDVLMVPCTYDDMILWMYGDYGLNNTL